jgi:hypothetical protein
MKNLLICKNYIFFAATKPQHFFVAAEPAQTLGFSNMQHFFVAAIKKCCTRKAA